MTLYWCLYILLFFFAFLDRKQKNDKKIFILLSSMLIALPALRSKNSSADTLNYINYFLHPELGYKMGEQFIEIGYHFFGKVILFFTNEWEFFIFITTLVSLIPLSLVIYKYSRNKSLSLFLLLVSGPVGCQYFFYFGIIRQCMSVAILFLILYYYDYLKKNIWLLITIFILSISFHSSSIIAFPVIFIDKISFTKKWGLIVTFLTVIIGYSNSLPSLFTYASYFDKSFYFDFRYFEKTNSLMQLVPLNFISLFIFCTIKRCERNNTWIKLLLLTTWIQNILLFNIANNLERFLFFFFLSILIVVPNYYENKNINIKYRFIVICFTVIYYSYKFFTVLLYQMSINKMWGSPVPYKTFFN